MQVLTSVIVLSIFAAVFIISDIKDYKARKANSTESMAHVIGINCIPTILFQDEETANEILAELKTGTPDILNAAIIDTTGKVFASYSRKSSDSLAFTRQLVSGNEGFIGKELFVTTDIVNNDKVIGKVALRVELLELEAIKKARYEMAAFLLLGAVLFSFLVAFVVQRYISRRLLYLVDTMNTVSRTGNYNTPIVDKGKDEISTLVHVYNNLMTQVRESQHKKDEFIGIASHELKTPLTSIKGYLDLLNMMEDKEPNKQFVQQGLASVNKLERLIKDLLDVSKIQSGQLQLNINRFNIDELINETIGGFQMVAGSHAIIKESNLEGEFVEADRQRIEQVLINLLSNAIKYSPNEDKVIVQGKREPGQLKIRVRDFGIGIPPEETGDIFERFYRTKDSSMHISGFGLGLYICRDIISRHGGKIWVENEPQGSSFYFTLPVKETLRQ